MAGQQVRKVGRVRRFLFAIVLMLGLGMVEIHGSSISGSAAASQDQSCKHVYLFRGGFGGVFSLGMDRLAGKIKAAGYAASVHTDLGWRSVAKTIRRKYIVTGCSYAALVGHSSGGSAAVAVANFLKGYGVPIRLVVLYDTSSNRTVGDNVHRAVAYLVPGVGQPIGTDPSFRGTVSNVNVETMFVLGHLTIDASPDVHRLTLTEIRQAYGY